MNLSIVIPTYNRWVSLKNLLDQIYEQVYGNFEVIVINDCSNEYYNVKGYKNLVYIKNEVNLGNNKSFNIGFKMASKEIVLWLTDDVELYPNAIPNIVNYLRASDYQAVVFYIYGNGWEETRFQDGRFFVSVGATYKKIMDEVGYWNEDERFHGGDVDWSKRVWDAGYKIGRCDEARVKHLLLPHHFAVGQK